MIRRPPRSTLFPYTNALPILAADLLVAGGIAEAQVAVAFIELEQMRHHALAVGRAQRANGHHGHGAPIGTDRKSTRLNSSHSQISYAVFCLKKKNRDTHTRAL